MQLLPTTYFGPVSWYQQLHRAGRIVIDTNEVWVKQTFRNRCTIATTAGTQILTVPVEHTGGKAVNIRDVRISGHGNWRHRHWNAISSAYGHSPFFQFYEDDLRPFFFEEKWEYLFDFNLDIIHKMCELLDIKAPSNLPPKGEASEVSSPIDSLLPEASPFGGRLEGAYWQVFQQKHGFLPDLSILDLLCCMGNEAVLYL